MEITVNSAMPAAAVEAGQEDLPPPVVASEFQQPAAEIEPKTDEGTGESDITREIRELVASEEIKQKEASKPFDITFRDSFREEEEPLYDSPEKFFPDPVSTATAVPHCENTLTSSTASYMVMIPSRSDLGQAVMTKSSLTTSFKGTSSDVRPLTSRQIEQQAVRSNLDELPGRRRADRPDAIHKPGQHRLENGGLPARLTGIPGGLSEFARRSLQNNPRNRVHSWDSNLNNVQYKNESRSKQLKRLGEKERRGSTGEVNRPLPSPCCRSDSPLSYRIAQEGASRESRASNGRKGSVRSETARGRSWSESERRGSRQDLCRPCLHGSNGRLNQQLHTAKLTAGGGGSGSIASSTTSSSSKGQDVAVVYVRGGNLAYGKGKRRREVLSNLNLTVNKGQIYALLGASGCGKTTLLSVIVGRRHLDSGIGLVFGAVPGRDPLSGIPGPRIGYMSQEIALYSEFTVKETAFYFGRIYGLSRKQIRLQLEFLTNLLDIPQENRVIGSFSGGQQRRISFLISLLPDPQLLILDEPTVGVDPILREIIWSHLVHLATQRQKTIIITTHYINESRQANRVGMLSGGRLLAEDSPSNLVARFKSDGLEDVFLKLCLQDRSRPKTTSTKTTFDKNTLPDVISNVDPPPLQPYRESAGLKNKLNAFLPSVGNIRALIRKNFLKLRRNPAMLLFTFLLPAIQVIFFCVAIGQEPRDLRLGVVNEESTNCSYLPLDECELSDLSCRYLGVLQQNTDIVSYDNTEEGEEGVLNGDVWGLISIKSNFSGMYVSRMLYPTDATEYVLDESSLHIRMDMSNQQVALTLQKRILDSFDNFTRTILESCSYPQEAASLPIRWLDPIFGDKDPSFTEFMAPGIIILIIYFLAVALTGEAFISERESGLLDRSLVAGVKPLEIVVSHISAQFVVMVVQTAVTLVTIIWGFKIPCRGPFFWLALLTLLQGLAGMSFGFLISSLCDTQAVAMQLSIGSFYPNLLLSGILWPLEGMPPLLKRISLFLPNTLACVAMRDIMLRGWGIDRPEVYLGVVSSGVWILIFLSLSLIVVKIRT